ncbi:hypothetical protein GCM10027596_03960 [Nocardioides korecus]
MKSTRRYTMTARAAAVAETRTRLMRATFELSHDHLMRDITLEAVAGRAGVSVQTLLRQFGSRDGLLEATREFARAEIREERQTPVGDVEAAVRVVVDHYEVRGDLVLLLLAQESTDAMVRSITGSGREVHRTWVREVFAPYLDEDDGTRLDLLVVATDLFTWKLLRRDRRHSRAVTEARMRTLVAAVLAGPTSKEAEDG